MRQHELKLLVWSLVAALATVSGCGSETAEPAETDAGATTDAGGGGDAAAQADTSPGLACGDGTVEQDGECVAECGPGTELKDGKCVAKCGPGTKLEDGSCVLDPEAAKPKVKSVALKSLHALGAKADTLLALHAATVSMTIEVEGEAFETSAVVYLRSGDKSCVVGNFTVTHNGGEDKQTITLKEEMLVQAGCAAFDGTKDASLEVSFDPFVATVWAERGEAKIDEKASDAVNIAALLAASSLPSKGCTKPADAPAKGFACNDKVAVGKSPGKNVRVVTARNPNTGGGPDAEQGSELMVVTLEDTSEALASTNTWDDSQNDQIKADYKAALLAEGVTDTALLNAADHLPKTAKSPGLDAFKGTGNSRPDIVAVVGYRVYGLEEEEELEDDLSMDFAIRPANATGDDWESLSTMLTTEAKAGEEDTVEYLEEIFFQGIQGVKTESMQSPVFIRGEAKRRLLLGDWKDEVTFTLRACAKPDFDEKGADAPEADNCIEMPLILLRKKVAPSVGEFTELQRPSDEPPPENPGGGLSSHYLPKKGSCWWGGNHCDFTLHLPTPGTQRTHWTYDFWAGIQFFDEEFGFGGGAFMNMHEGTNRWYNAGTNHNFKPGLGLYGHAYLKNRAKARFSTRDNRIAMWLYRPWKQPNPGGYIDEIIQQFIESLKTFTSLDPSGTAQGMLDLLEGKGADVGKTTFGALFDIYTSGMHLRVWQNELVDIAFPIPFLNVPEKPTATTLMELKLFEGKFDVGLGLETVTGKNGIEFGLTVGKSFELPGNEKKVGPATFKVEAKVEAKLKFAIIREKKELEVKFKQPKSQPPGCFWKVDDNRCYMRSPNDMNYWDALDYCKQQGGKLYMPHTFRPNLQKDKRPKFLNQVTYKKDANYVSQNGISPLSLFESTKGVSYTGTGVSQITKDRILKIAAGTPDPLAYVLNLRGGLLNEIARPTKSDWGNGTKGPLLHPNYKSKCPSHCLHPSGGIYYKKGCLRNSGCTVAAAALQASFDAESWLIKELYKGAPYNDAKNWIRTSRHTYGYYDHHQKMETAQFAQQLTWYNLVHPNWRSFWVPMAKTHMLLANPYWYKAGVNMRRYRDDVAKYLSNNYSTTTMHCPYWSASKCGKYNNDNFAVLNHFNAFPVKGASGFTHSNLYNYGTSNNGYTSDYHRGTQVVPWEASLKGRALCEIDTANSKATSLKGKKAESYALTIQPGFELGGGVEGRVKVAGFGGMGKAGLSGSGTVTLVDVTLPFELLGVRTYDDSYGKLSVHLKLVLEILKLKFALRVKLKIKSWFVKVKTVDEKWEVSVKPVDELIKGFGGDKKKEYTKWEWSLFGPHTQETLCNTNKQCTLQ